MATSSSVGDSSFLQLLRENYLECSLCCETYKEPKYLSCHHTFCQGCLVDFRKHKPGDIVCPTCREITKIPGGGIPGLRNNFLIKSLTYDVSLFRDQQVKCDNCSEGKMAAMVCVECAMYLCTGCFESHQKVKSIRDSHNTFQVEMLQNVAHLQQFQKNRFATCPIHNESMKLYCTIDKIQLCHTCSFGSSHQDHKMCPIQEKLEQLLAEITDTLEKSQVSDSVIAAENKKLEEVKFEVEKSKTRSLADLDKEESEFLLKVQEKYKTMRNEIKAASEESRKTCDAKIKRNNFLQKSGEGKIAEKEALTMIPISSCIEAAEGFLTGIKEADQSAIQKVNAAKEGKNKYFEANKQGFVVNSGCVKTKCVSSVQTKPRVFTQRPIYLKPKDYHKYKNTAVVDEPVDKSMPHYKNGRNVKFADRVVEGPDWLGLPLDGAATVIEIRKYCVKVKWDDVKVKWDDGCWPLSHTMSDRVYQLQLAPQ